GGTFSRDASRGFVFGILPILLRRGHVDVGMLEEPEPYLGFNDGTNGIVDLCRGDPAILESLGEMLGIGGVSKSHLHIDARSKRPDGSVGGVFGKTVNFKTL